MPILVTGGSGFLGGAIVRALVAAGETRIRVLARPGSDLSALAGIPCERVNGDLLDPDSLRQALEGVSQLFHAAGLIRFRPQDAQQVRRVNLDGTRHLFEAALAAGVRRVVYSASIFTVGAAQNGALATEDMGYNTPDLLDIPYIQAKWGAEQAAQAAAARGLKVIRLYPGLCFGPGDHNRSSTGAVDAWLRGMLPAVVRGGGIPVIDVRDAAQAHLAAMAHGVPGRRYLAPGYNLTLDELFARLSHLTGRPGPLMLPARVGILAARLLDWLPLALPVDSAQARLMARQWWFDDSRARQELGIAYRPLDTTLAETVAWLRDHPRRRVQPGRTRLSRSRG